MPKITRNQSLSSLSRFGIGGKVRKLITVKNEKELREAMLWTLEQRSCPTVVGHCNNILFSDKPLVRPVIQIRGSKITLNDKNGEVSVFAGTELLRFVRKMTKLGYSGFAALAGIPGSIGGAIVGNAGAYGASISDHLRTVKVLSGSKLFDMDKDACQFAYRESVFKKKRGLIVVSATFALVVDEKGEEMGRMKSILKTRGKKFGQMRCPGSYFKNVLLSDIPKSAQAGIDPAKIRDGKIPAGHLIELAGFLGKRVGGAAVSHHHANIIENLGKAKAADVITLARNIKSAVKKRFGVVLLEEVRFVS